MIHKHSNFQQSGDLLDNAIDAFYQMEMPFSRTEFFRTFRASTRTGERETTDFHDCLVNLQVRDFADIELNADKNATYRDEYVKKSRDRFAFKIAFLVEFPDATLDTYLSMLAGLDNFSASGKNFENLDVSKFLDQSQEFLDVGDRAGLDYINGFMSSAVCCRYAV